MSLVGETDETVCMQLQEATQYELIKEQQNAQIYTKTKIMQRMHMHLTIQLF